MIALLLSSLAFAQDAPVIEIPDSVSPRSTASSKKGANKKRKRGKRKKEEWKSQFYARPMLAGSSFTTPDGETRTALGIGARGAFATGKSTSLFHA